ncbi:MAG TPA: ABC transporter ATP-binding protein [Stellaceae bacterium]|nr:ABC transporter ATP-binding protein [Stellaceae bacterium]
MAGIEVRSVSQSFGTAENPIVALREASLSISKGELLCLIGPSGCGKSTLLNIMAGLARASAGEVLIDGMPVRGPVPKKMAFVFQENTLVPWRTALDNIRLGLAFQGAPKAGREERARAALDLVGMSEFANHYPRQLSGGMKQRVQLARALALDTDIILMDEPFAALDEQTRMVLGEELSVLLAREGKTIVFVTHSLTEAVFLADRVAVFSARPGCIKAVIPVEESHPRPRSFMTSEKLTSLRNQLYEMLHDEVLATVRASLGMPAGH